MVTYYYTMYPVLKLAILLECTNVGTSSVHVVSTVYGALASLTLSDLEVWMIGPSLALMLTPATCLVAFTMLCPSAATNTTGKVLVALVLALIVALIVALVVALVVAFEFVFVFTLWWGSGMVRWWGSGVVGSGGMVLKT